MTFNWNRRVWFPRCCSKYQCFTRDTARYAKLESFFFIIIIILLFTVRKHRFVIWKIWTFIYLFFVFIYLFSKKFGNDASKSPVCCHPDWLTQCPARMCPHPSTLFLHLKMLLFGITARWLHEVHESRHLSCSMNCWVMSHGWCSF